MDSNGHNGNGRIELLKKREAEIRAAIAAETVKRKKREFNGNERIAALKRLFDGKGIPLGYSQSGKVLRYVGQEHLILIAPMRVSHRVPFLLPWLLDMPGDNAEIRDNKSTERKVH